MDGFKRFLGFEPNAKIAVLIFRRLFYGFGLATKLQQLDLSKNGLVTNIVQFQYVGVEIWRKCAGSDGGVDRPRSYWRTRSSFLRHAFATTIL